MKKLVLTLLLVAGIAGVSAQAIYPKAGENWPKARPSKYGFNEKKMKELRKYIIDSMQTTGLMVIVGGECIYQFGNVERISYIASCRKSVLSMLYGKYVENGTIDLNKTIGELGITDHGGLLPIEQKAKILHLIQARSGVYHAASNPGSSLDNPEYVPERGSKKPGTYHLYNNWDFNVAGTVFEQLTGKSVYQALEEDLAKPLGFQDWDIKNQRYGGKKKYSIHPAYHIYVSTRDMARIGYLMLRDGKWEDKQIISKDWHDKMIAFSTPRNQMNPKKSRKGQFGYGYMWWLYDVKRPGFKGAYAAHGAMGQYITIFPELDMVVVHKTDSVYGRKTKSSRYQALLRKIVAAKLENN
ncbi:MAG: serine hydrolase [Rikenellaceae bacterium]|nr:serine hydrolase [Rikenellaceae bacterium]